HFPIHPKFSLPTNRPETSTPKVQRTCKNCCSTSTATRALRSSWLRTTLNWPPKRSVLYVLREGDCEFRLVDQNGLPRQQKEPVALASLYFFCRFRNRIDGCHCLLCRKFTERYRWTGSRIDRCRDRKSTRLNSSHVKISYAVFCSKKKSRAASAPPPRSPATT